MEDSKKMTETCQGCGCQTNASFSCPKCIELDIKPNFFCSQGCFAENWRFHKQVHDTLIIIRNNRDAFSSYRWDNSKPWLIDTHLRLFCNYKFTGILRPWSISPMRTVPKSIPYPDYGECGYSATERRLRGTSNIHIHTAEELQRLRESCQLGRKALDYAHSLVKPGVTTDYIDYKVHEFIIQHGAYPSPLNYEGFPKSCCTSVNEVICHGIPDFRPLEEGDIINIDITVYYKGMHGDLNETFCVGNVSPERKELIKTAHDCLMNAIKICRPGTMYREVGKVISVTAEDAGCSVVRSYCGHGIGELFHTSPNVPHYRKNKAIGVMKPGHVFTIEPMINRGNFADICWPDNWTAVTQDGSDSAQFEHTLYITESGVEILTARTPESPPFEF